ncbi:glycosyltransferase family 2 protein [Cupriavidus oxalaticus]|uniref:Glycosyltransferase family 2 protein n=2 Tax=Cupriavidus oxalaticus TaxID=96344 RepID=A0A4P7L7K2_9BURK|nr:glycosyltransferase family 2 protein [Cupriavidus oxalaticus]
MIRQLRKAFFSRAKRSRWWQRLRREFGIRDLHPAAGIDTLPVSGEYRSTGQDPQFRLKGFLPAGWYMVEVNMTLALGQADARFYLDTGDGESEEMSFALPVRSGKLAKRVLCVPAEAKMRFDPLASVGSFTIGHFRVVRVLEAFARPRVLRKLRNIHPRYRQSDTGERYRLSHYWSDYNALFEGSQQDSEGYARWIEKAERTLLPDGASHERISACWKSRPTFSILLPTFNTRESQLRDCLDSILAQTYPHWDLCVADDASTEPHVAKILAEYAQRDARIRVIVREHNGHICAASNTALSMAGQDFVVLLDHDDTLAANALFAVAQHLQSRPTAQILYSDEDKIDDDGHRFAPFFKPDWSPDLLYAQNYVCHLGIYRRELVTAVGGFRPGFEGSQDYDLLLRCVARVTDSRDIVHIPMVLYHWRASEGSTALGHDRKDYAAEAARRALQEHMDRHHPGVVMEVTRPGIYRPRWPVPAPPPLVSLIVPTRDGYDILRTCIESILQKTSYPNYEILIVDNQSTCPQTLAYMAEICADASRSGRVRLLQFDFPFNYSAINNFAAKEARGSILGLINNDVEVINADWLTEMVSHAVRPDIGCVGAKLYYPDRTIQHAGVVLGIGGVAGHSHKYLPGHADGYFGRLLAIHNVSAVTGAALLVRRAVFDLVGGLDQETLKVAFNDVDFCIKVRDAGFRNLWTPFAELFHHESKSRGTDETEDKRKRFALECEVMQERWGSALSRDPFYNPNLTLVREDYSLASHQSLVGGD